MISSPATLKHTDWVLRAFVELSPCTLLPDPRLTTTGAPSPPDRRPSAKWLLLLRKGQNNDGPMADCN